MTLIITALAAIIVTIVRFAKPDLARRASLGVLALTYWGASLMWTVDGFAALAEGEPFVELADAAAMADDALLGICVVGLGLIVWAVVALANRSRAKRAAAAV